MSYQSAYKTIGAALRTALARTGVHTGGSAAYPRVELHTFTEGGTQDKDDSYRTLAVTMESLSEVSPDEAAALNEGNLAILADFSLADGDFSVIGVIPTQMTQSSETTENQSLYRVAQQLDIHIISS